MKEIWPFFPFQSNLCFKTFLNVFGGVETAESTVPRYRRSCCHSPSLPDLQSLTRCSNSQRSQYTHRDRSIHIEIEVYTQRSQYTHRDCSIHRDCIIHFKRSQYTHRDRSIHIEIVVYTQRSQYIHRDRSIHIEIVVYIQISQYTHRNSKIKNPQIIEHFRLILPKLGHFGKGQNYFCLQNSFPYSADVKPTVNKNHFEFFV